MQPDWKDRHPFTLGQRVYVKPHCHHRGLDPATGYAVAMRGETEHGPWITLVGVSPYEFSVADFTAIPPMPAVQEVAGEEEGV